MAIRAAACEVRDVIETDPDVSLLTHMKNASIVTDRISSNATDQEITITSDELKLIETYLAAHFYALSDKQEQEEGAGKSKVVYQGKTGMNFDLTWWGQMANMLDPTNTLSSDIKVGVTWLGTERT